MRPGLSAEVGAKPVQSLPNGNAITEAILDNQTTLVGGRYDLLASPEATVILAIGVVPFKPLGSVPLVIWGVGPTGDPRTYLAQAVTLNAPDREKAKEIACRNIDAFFDAWNSARTPWFSHQLRGGIKPFTYGGVSKITGATIIGAFKEEKEKP